MNHSAMWLFFHASPRRFFTSSRWRRHLAVGNCDSFAWVVLFSMNSLIFMDQSPLMYFKAIFSSLGITSWNKLLNGRMVASRLRSLPQSWLLNLPRRNCWLRKTPKMEIPNMFGHPQLHGFPSIFMDFPLKVMELEGIFIRPPIFCPWSPEPTVHSWKMGRERDDEILFRRSSLLGTSDIGPWVLDHKYRYPKAAFLVHLGQQHTTRGAYHDWNNDICHSFYEPSFCVSRYIGHWVTFQGWLWWVKSYEHYPKSVLNPHSLPVPLCLNTCVQCEWFVCDKVAMYIAYIALCSLVSCRFRHLSCGLWDTLWLQLWRFTEQPQKCHKNSGPMMNS